MLQAHRVDGLLRVEWEKQTERKTQYVGRGRGSASREKRVIKNIRSHITGIVRQEDRIATLTRRFGWKAFVTNAVQKRLSLMDAVLCYRNAYRVERILKAFSGVSLVIVKHAVGEEIMRQLTPWSGLQEEILQRQGLSTSLYGQLEIQEIGN